MYINKYYSYPRLYIYTYLYIHIHLHNGNISMYNTVVYTCISALGLMKRIDKESGWVNGGEGRGGVYGFKYMLKKTVVQV